MRPMHEKCDKLVDIIAYFGMIFKILQFCHTTSKKPYCLSNAIDYTQHQGCLSERY
jgi:hypothetical protein